MSLASAVFGPGRTVPYVLTVARAIMTARPLVATCTGSPTEVQRRLVEAAALEGVRYAWWLTPDGIAVELGLLPQDPWSRAGPHAMVLLRGELRTDGATTFRGVIRRTQFVQMLILWPAFLLALGVLCLLYAPLAAALGEPEPKVYLGTAAFCAGGFALPGTSALRAVVDAFEVHVRLLDRALGRPVDLGAPGARIP